MRGRLFGLVGTLLALWLLSVAVATYGLLNARAQSDSIAANVTASGQAHSAYESWLADDSASNMYVALASLNDRRQRAWPRPPSRSPGSPARS